MAGFRPRTSVLLGAAAASAAAAAVAVAERRHRRRLDADPEYRELGRPLDGRPRTVVSRDNTELHVEVFGDEARPTLLLAHGWTCALRMWHPQIVELSRDFRVVAYDQRGHGASGRGAFSAEALADDLASVLATSVPSGAPVLVAGHSMGAMSILAWAERHPGEVGRIAGAVLISTGMADLVLESTVLPLPRRLARSRRAIGARVMSTPPVSPPWAGPISRRAVRHVTLGPGASAAQVAFCHDLVRSCPRDTWRGWGEVLARIDLRVGAERLGVPTLVMAGERDRLTPPVHARRLQHSLARPAGVVIVPGAGHMLPVEAAGEVNRHLRDLAADVLVSAAAS